MSEEKSTQRHLVCTIAAPNYLSQLLALGKSMALSMPETSFRVLVLQDCPHVDAVQRSIDTYLGELESASDHRAVGIDECDWRDFDVAAAMVFYSTLEFATSVKPALLRHFLHEGWQRVTYLDPDIQVFNNFEELLDDSSSISLTPHFLSDIPDDGEKPSTNDILKAGFFNLGFCSVRPNAESFLNWWSERLQFHCLVDIAEGYFTDQKIVDLARLKTDVQIVQDPGCNVAYWNLHERRIVNNAGQWCVQHGDEVRTLYFFHFSGFRMDESSTLSVHATRKVVGDIVPRAFVQQYAELRRSLEPPEPLFFTLAGTPGAAPVPHEWRAALRDDVTVHVRAGASLKEVREAFYPATSERASNACASCETPHATIGMHARSFLEGWTRHPSLVGVPNAISALFFPDHRQYQASAIEQLTWATHHFAERVTGNDDLVDLILVSAAEAMKEAVELRVIGYFAYAAGTGQIARWAVQTMEAAGIVPAIDYVYAGHDSNEYLSALLRRRNPISAANASVLAFINADQWENHVLTPGRVNASVAHVEAVWAWELEYIPSEMYEIASADVLERVHALSNWGSQAMSKVLPIPVSRIAPFDATIIQNLKPVDCKSGILSSKRPYVLTTFDAKSYLSRKNPEGVLEIWRRVLRDFPNHRLVIKSSDLRDVAPTELLNLIEATPRTELIDEHLDDAAYLDLLKHADVYVTLHRSEGMGLTPIEAGLCGIPVVYTNYGGVTDFMEEGFFPVAYSLTQVGESDHQTGPYDKVAWWAEPDLDDAEQQLRSALALASEDGPLSALILDRKRLTENLLTAQAEVVDTAQRLLHLAHESQHLVEDQMTNLQSVLDDPSLVVEESRANPVFLKMLAVVYFFYRRLPRAFRYQFNVALNKLRGRSGIS